MDRRRAPRPTLEAVAARAGVSRATVSRVVNGSPTVRWVTRNRVDTAIKDLGYHPNLAARNLVTRRTDAIALVMGESPDATISDPFFSRLIVGISHELSAAGLQSLLLVRGSNDNDRVARYLDGGHVDGAIAFSVHRDDPLGAAVRDAPIPVIFGGRPWGDPGPVGYVDVDQRGGARLAVGHLAGLGRRRIATITGPMDQYAAAARYEGYCDAIGTVDPALVAHGDFTRAAGERAMSVLLDRVGDLDAVFAASDLTAAGAMRVLHRAGRRVPEDVAVVGFDDFEEIAEGTDPPLTTVRQPLRRLGQRLVEVLVTALDGGAAPVGEVLPVRLVRRGSA